VGDTSGCIELSDTLQIVSKTTSLKQYVCVFEDCMAFECYWLTLWLTIAEILKVVIDFLDRGNMQCCNLYY